MVEPIVKGGDRGTLHCRTPPSKREVVKFTASGIRVSVKSPRHSSTALYNNEQAAARLL